MLLAAQCLQDHDSPFQPTYRPETAQPALATIQPIRSNIKEPGTFSRDIEQNPLTQLEDGDGTHADLDLHRVQLLLKAHEDWVEQLAAENLDPGGQKT